MDAWSNGLNHGDEIPMPLDYPTDGRLVITKARSYECDQWGTLSLCTHIRVKDPGDQKTLRAKGLREPRV